jgi:hypothetical protein
MQSLLVEVFPSNDCQAEQNCGRCDGDFQVLTTDN